MTTHLSASQVWTNQSTRLPLQQEDHIKTPRSLRPRENPISIIIRDISQLDRIREEAGSVVVAGGGGRPFFYFRGF